MATLLEIEALSKHFGPITAVDGIGFSVPRGQVLGFLGPNGAGKSTTMRMITGYLPPSAGRITVCGFDVAERPIEVRRRLGYLPEGAPTYGDMTPLGILRFVAATRGLGGDKHRRIDEMVARLELKSVLHQPIETLSKGFKCRVGLALALLHDPEVLILDEPTDGLDPNQKHQVRALLADLAPHKAIVISTHILEEVDALCARATIIARGRIVADARPGELIVRSAYHNAVTLRLPRDQTARAKATLEHLDAVARVDEPGDHEDGAQLTAFPRNGADILPAVRDAVAQDGIPVDEIHIERGRLDDVFRQLTEAA